jgi:L-alanine-DL-glutamate epimerase-like enolase superfamily enzyme
MKRTVKREVPDTMTRRRFVGSAAAAACLGLPSPGRGAGARRSEKWMAELAAHRIARIERRRLRMQWPRQVGKNSRRDVHGTGTTDSVAVVHTERGAMGWGLGRFTRGQSPEAMTAQLKGTPVSALFAPDTGIRAGCPRVLDFALHDLAGVILNVPVYALLGGSKPRATPCYSGMIYFDDLEPPVKPAGIDRVLANCRQDHDLGYRQLKIKIGRSHRWMPHDAGLARDIKVTRAIARAFPDVKLLVDANDGYTIDDVKRYLEGIGGVELLWFEEPFRESVEGFRELRAVFEDRGIKTCIADGEAGPDARLLDRLMEAGLLDVYLTDILGYGFTPWRKLMPRLKKQGVLASPHAFGTQLKTYCIAHLASAFGNTLTIEGVTCSSKDVDWGGYRLDARGELAPPPEPGFGMRLRKA